MLRCTALLSRINQLSARHRVRYPGCAGEAQRSSGRHPRGEEAEALRFQRITIPSHDFDWVDRHAQSGAQGGHDRAVVPAAAADQPAPGWGREARRGYGSGRDGGFGVDVQHIDALLASALEKSSLSSDFGAGFEK